MSYCLHHPLLPADWVSPLNAEPSLDLVFDGPSLISGTFLRVPHCAVGSSKAGSLSLHLIDIAGT